MGESAGSAGSGVAGAAGSVAAGRGLGAAGGAAVIAVGVLSAPVRLLAVADARGPVIGRPAATPGVPAPGPGREDAMPEACPPLPEERASAAAVSKDDSKRTVAGRRTSVGLRADLGVNMLTPFKLMDVEGYQRLSKLSGSTPGAETIEPGFSAHHKLASRFSPWPWQRDG
jgi:hypothetical protein